MKQCILRACDGLAYHSRSIAVTIGIMLLMLGPTNLHFAIRFLSASAWVILIGVFLDRLFPDRYSRHQRSLQYLGNLRFSDEQSQVFAPPKYQHVNEHALPFSGTWEVVNGGVSPGTSHSWDILSQRYAYDFVRWMGPDAAEILSRRLEDYPSFGEKVLASCQGKIIAVAEQYPDFPFPRSGMTDWRCASILGNHVIIEHPNCEFSLYAHLKQGSVLVNLGDQVQAGTPIAACGNSGNSSEPHLHFQVQNGCDFFSAHGIPVSFKSYDVLPDNVAIETVGGNHYLSQGAVCRQNQCIPFNESATISESR